MTGANNIDRFACGDIAVEVRAWRSGSRTFALFAGEAPQDSIARRALFTGHVQIGMASQLRRLAARLDEIEDELRRRDARKARKLAVRADD